MIPELTIGVTTRNRQEALVQCLASLAVLEPLSPEVLVFDDGSEQPADVSRTLLPVRVLRDTSSPGYIVGRNRIVREAAAPCVLLLDDDTRIISVESVRRAMAVLEADATVGAVAFAQANEDGSPWPASMQPAPVDYDCVVPSFIGFAHLVRRDLFLRLGGYREDFIFYGEEKEYCLRLIDAGFRTVYLPEALISHIPDPSGRSRTRYLRFVARNDCLNSLYNDPLTKMLWTIPGRIVLYFRMRRGWGIDDPGGGRWLIGEVLRKLPAAWHDRRPVSRAAIARWQELKGGQVPYHAAR